MPYLAVIYVLLIVIVLVDIVVTDGRTVRGVPKPVWALLSMALPLIGPIAWLALGRPQKDEAEAQTRPDHTHRMPPTSAPESDPDIEAALFAARVRERAAEQRRRARLQRESDDQD